MIGKYPPLTERVYKKNHFSLIPSNFSNMLFLFFHDENIGFINTKNINILRNGNVKTIFFYLTEAEICNGHLTCIKGGIGLVKFTFNENTKKWKLYEIFFNKIPAKLLPLTRKVFLEKINKNKHNFGTNPCLEIQL